jgi:hypothetical protein
MCTVINKNNNIINLIKKKLKDNIDNPKIIIENINYKNLKINIIQDGCLIAGTKQRVAKTFIKKILKNNNVNTLLYAGTSNGFGAIATAYAAYKLGLKSEVFLGGNIKNTNTRQINTLLALNSKVNLCNTYREARNLEFKISDDPNKKWNTLPDYYIVPMGLNDKDGIMINLLSKQIKKASKNTILEELNNKNKLRIWLVAGSGGISMALKKAFPNSILFLLLTGSGSYKQNVIEWSKKEKNIVILNNNHNLSNIDSTKYYSSVKNYDDLIFPYVIKYGKNEDFIWNVASDDYLYL